MTLTSPEHLVQIVDSALADAVARSGHWLACRPGCSQCCHGVFAISLLDAERLRKGLWALTQQDPERAAQVRARVSDAVTRLSLGYPGSSATGYLDESQEAIEQFEEFANDEACPVLDPATQTCDLYWARPILCRTFGPPILTSEGGLAVCDLCFEGAPPEEVERCQLDRSILVAEVEAEELFLAREAAVSLVTETNPARTTIAFALSIE